MALRSSDPAAVGSDAKAGRSERTRSVPGRRHRRHSGFVETVKRGVSSLCVATYVLEGREQTVVHVVRLTAALALLNRCPEYDHG